MVTNGPNTIDSPDAPVLLANHPVANVNGIGGVRVYDVGQGDGICILDQDLIPFLQIDYGGVQGHPFAIAGSAEARMPLQNMPMVMLTHWDKDHWWTARKNPNANNVRWLVPRQTTSPAAVKFSQEHEDIRCIPERLVGRRLAIKCHNGDLVIFEKIDKMPDPATSLENCNRTGVAFSVLKASTKQVILLPGDARFHKVNHYQTLRRSRTELRGLVAFHHGAGSRWSPHDSAFLSAWRTYSEPVDVVFSYAEGNSYGHPDVAKYFCIPATWKETRTPELRDNGQLYKDILF